MKKINSIGYGGKILGVSAVFIIVIPSSMEVLMLVWENRFLFICARISAVLGVCILLLLMVLLGIEFHQDKRADFYYESQINRKMYLGEDRYECYSCGNRLVKAEDTSCHLCGMTWKGE